ncbi:autotransporter domain-containing protein [Candidatus Pelagibacter ubique]|nr:autotransporter domain-containing protein [Candidatus Pelagibacter ubique]
MLNYLKKIFSIFLIFNLTFVSSAQAAATFVDRFDVSGQDTTPRGLTFNNDGTKMFVVGNTGNDINVYTLSIGFDLTSTVTFNDINGDGTGFDISGQDDTPQGIAFNNDGTKMFVVGNTGNDINVYTLSIGFDLTSTVTFNDINGDGTGFDISGQDDTPQGIAFNNDGTKMFVAGNANDDINEYTLSIGFDLSSTITYVGAFNVSTQDDTPQGIVFNNDGTKMFVVGNANDDINEYTLSCAFKVTASSKCDAPPKIKDVRGIVDAQINTVKNFAKDSSQSALKRLANLRAKDDNKNAQKIELNFQNETLNKISNNVLSSAPAKFNPIQKLDQILPNDWAAWSEGSVSLGKIDDNPLSSVQDITSLGISIGADKKTDNDKVLGVALRVGNTDVDVGTYGSKVDTNALSLSVYGSNSFDDRNFLEHVIGASYLDSDITRKNQGNTNTQTGDREGKQVFGSLNFGREYEDGDVIITPTGRIDGSYTALDSYTENGNEAIRYNDQDIKSLMASLGVLIDQDADLENSNVRSRINLEYGKELGSNSKVVTSYVSDNENFEYQADKKNKDIYTVGLGFDFKHDHGLTISTDYQKQKIRYIGFINKFTLSAGFLSRNETEFALGLSKDMTSSFKISKALGVFDLEFNLENDFSNQENHNANLSLSSKF